MQSKYLILLICLLSFTLILQSSAKSDLPLSWDVWYHLQISRQFSQGEFFWDSGSFGPEGRPHTYPPLFHFMTAAIYTTTDIPLETLARFLPPFLFAVTIYTFYILVKEVLNEKIALVSCLFASVCPILLDRGLSYTPEALSFIFFNAGLTFFWKSNWKMTGVMGGLLILTHGITTAAFFFILFIYTISAFVVLRENYWKHFLLVVILSGAIAFMWAVHSLPSFIPYGGKEPLNIYPQKLGWIQTLLTFLGLTFLTKDKRSIFLLSFSGALFLLSQNPVSLPYRFIEFLAFPVCILAGIAVSSIRIPKVYYSLSILILFLLSYAQGYWYIEKYSSVVTHEEREAFVWLNENSVSGTVMSEWRTAPLLSFFSGRAAVKGAYQFGAPGIRERTEDTQLFYTDYPGYILSKYEISFVYYGKEEKAHGNEPPYDKVYSTVSTGFYLPGCHFQKM